MNHPRRVGQGAMSAHIRHFHQRLILQRLRRLGAASRADLARAAGLTNTAIGAIIRQLAEQGLVRTLGKQHDGRRGQPGTLLALDPRGAYAIGVRLDRARIETVLTDLDGAVLSHTVHDGPLPSPAEAVGLVRDDVAAMVALVPEAHRDRIAGIGVARPFDLGSWLTELDLPRAAFESWHEDDFAAALHEATGLAVFEDNDGTAAGIAELFLGHGRAMDDFLYVFIGPAIGGGVVLEGRCVRGQSGNAGDLGLVPAAAAALPSAPPASPRGVLLGRAGLNALRRHLRYRGLAPNGVADIPADARDAAEEWLADCAASLRDPLLTARALLDIPCVVIDGDLAPSWIDRLLRLTEVLLADAIPESRTPPRLLRGSFGPMAGALGAATLPLFDQFGPVSGNVSARNSAADATAPVPRETDHPGGPYALVA